MYFCGNGVDGLGYTNNIIVGGTDETVVNDDKGPDVEIYFDDTSFEDSYLVTPNSELIVKLSDETGLNTTGTGVGGPYLYKIIIKSLDGEYNNSVLGKMAVIR